MGMAEDMKQSLGMKEKSAAEKMADKARSSVAKATDDVKGALGMRPKTDKYRDYGLAALRIALAMVALNGVSMLAGHAGAGDLIIGLFEAAAGLAILLGILARLSGALVALWMALAILLGSPLGLELEMLFLLCGIALALTGPGKYSLEEKLAGGRESVLHRI
jgi:uncharacterized membrane protein YphA (DoxX/SURF4 family)